ncbi:hypothetical protein F5B22DRAFT_595202 [Xylaria bambusicola]|uniref:uncharacterized protein n=1 Tax=Xylaria bambusicola TaxID=326684 RepID=UPI0020086AF1|nr:uncharacterized protein F5B22DRAFT_595202 [Xylaria bambusicola]KAI0521507.1 hypothetical protein F5B22DRAFT_595202 [Xylaria bambusicola]
MMTVSLVNIDHFEVLADIEQTNPSRAHGIDSTKARFNTAFHTEHEAPDLLARPSEKPYSFKRWLPLILRSRRLAPSDAQIVTLSQPQTRLLLRVAEASIPLGSINRIYREEIDEEIVPSFLAIEFPQEGLFMRFDACSAKDGMQKTFENSPLRSVNEALLLLLTSYRARNTMINALDDGAQVFEVFFMPWNDRMRGEREYRVFCPAFSSVDSLRISAISQYRWYQQWRFYLEPDKERRAIVERIVEGAEEIKVQIAAELDPEDEMDSLLMKQGLTFDVLYDEHLGAIDLIELNVFGVRSACGSCLFQWINDRKILEGQTEPKALEFRVTFVERVDRESSSENSNDEGSDASRDISSSC